jgi:AcrR family transcriptional regulator
MPKPTFHNLPDAKRQRIVDAAVAEFSTVAFEAASLNRIVKGAGIAKGSFYQYFDDLFDLFRWLLLEHLAADKLAFMSKLGPGPPGDLFDQLAWASLSGMKWGIANPRLAACGRQMFSHTNFGPLARLQAEIEDIGASQMRHILLDAQRQGVVRADVDLDLAASMMTSMRDMLDVALKRRLGFGIMDLVLEHRDVDLDVVEEVVRGVIDLVRRAVGSGSGGGELHLEDTPYIRHLRGEE